MQQKQKIQEKINWMRLLLTKGIGRKKIIYILAKYKNPKLAIEAIKSKKEFSLDFLHDKVETEERAIIEIEKYTKIGAKIIICNEALYPEELLHTYEYPVVLFALGDCSLLGKEKSKVAVVGSRKATSLSCEIAHKISLELSKKEVVIVSGLAKGIDINAHQGTGFKNTIGVIACGLNRIYPKEHKEYYQELIKKGLIITEYGLDTPPIPRNFLRRNRIIAGLGQATLIVEARKTSGSLTTARYAIEYGRELFVMPGVAFDLNSEGSNDLLKNGATICTNTQDILGYLDIFSNYKVKLETDRVILEEEENIEIARKEYFEIEKEDENSKKAKETIEIETGKEFTLAETNLNYQENIIESNNQFKAQEEAETEETELNKIENYTAREYSDVVFVEKKFDFIREGMTKLEFEQNIEKFYSENNQMEDNNAIIFEEKLLEYEVLKVEDKICSEGNEVEYSKKTFRTRLFNKLQGIDLLNKKTNIIDSDKVKGTEEYKEESPHAGLDNIEPEVNQQEGHSEDEKIVLNALTKDLQSIDEVAKKTKLKIIKLRKILSKKEREGLVEFSPIDLVRMVTK